MSTEPLTRGMTPDFRTLPALAGHPELRQVFGTFMDEEQYTTEGWHLTKTPDGSKYWVATLDGLRRYGQLTHQRSQERITAAVTRRESDNEWSDYIASLADAKPRYGA